MAYADKEMSSSRIVAIVVVALLHALLGYALVTGLAYNVVKQVAKDLKTFNVEEPPPPEEEPPPPPPETPETPPPVVAPPPIVRTNVQPVPIQIVREAPPPQITPTAPPAPPPAPPAPPRKVEAARAKADLRSYVSSEDYPSSALRAEESGTTAFRLDVGTNGRVTNCTVTSSSGSAALDAATCRVLKSRARFTPARDTSGNPTTDSVSSRIRWQLPED